jgi:hypothetical protein
MQIDLSKIVKDVWGGVYPEFLWNRIPAMDAPDKKGYVFARDVTNDMSSKGVPFYIYNKGVRAFMPTWLSASPQGADKFLLQNSVMTITNKKKIVTTELINRGGTVKEEISIGDWELTVKGLIVSNNRSYPEYEVQKLLNLYKRKSALWVNNARTAMCMTDGERVIMTDFNLPTLSGYENIQPYEIKLLSDIEFELEEI